MTNERTHATDCHTPSSLPHFSWTAAFAGAFVGMGLAFLINLLSIALGLGAASGRTTMAFGAVLGFLIGIIVSMFFAGYTAGYLGRCFCPKRNLGILYGFVTWCLALFLAALFSIPINHHVNSYSKTLNSSVVMSSDSLTMQVQDNAPALTGKANAANQANNQQTTDVTAGSNTLMWTALTVFGLFFLGALFSCIGACCAMKCKKREE